MGSTVTIECPGCQAQLNLSDPSKLGKKIKCSKCNTTFVAEAPDDAAEEAPAEPSVGKKKRRGNKGAAKKPEVKTGGNGLLIAAICGTFVVFLGVGLFLGGAFKATKRPAPRKLAPVAAAGPQKPQKLPDISRRESALSLRWLPPNTESLLHFKVGQLWQASSLKQVTALPQVVEIKDIIQKTTGLAPTQIQSVTIGFAETKAIVPFILGQLAGISGPLMPPRTLAVVRIVQSVTSEKLRETDEFLRPADHAGNEYFELARFEGFAMAVSNGSTLLIGPTEEVTAAMDRGETVIQRTELMGTDDTTNVVLIIAPREPKQLLQQIAEALSAFVPSSFSESRDLVQDGCLQFSANISISSGFLIQTTLTFYSDSAAEGFSKSVKRAVEELRNDFDGVKKNLPESLVQVVSTMIRAPNVESRLRVAKVAFGVPDAVGRHVEKLPALMLGYAATGTMPVVNPVASETGAPRAEEKVSNPVKTSDPVAAESADGLPEGVTLTACVGESSAEVEVDGKKSRPYQIYLDLTGVGVQNICVAGMLTPESMDLPTEGTLRQSRAKGNQDATVLPVFFDPANPRSGEPPGRLRMTLNIERAPKLETEISKFEGSFIYQSLANARHDHITITSAPKRAGKRITETKLKAAGFNMVIGNVPVGKKNTEVLMLSWRTGFFIRQAELDFGRGRAPVGFVPTLWQGELKLTATPPDSAFFTGEEKLTFDLYRDVTQHEVKFKFTKVQLPVPVK